MTNEQTPTPFTPTQKSPRFAGDDQQTVISGPGSFGATPVSSTPGSSELFSGASEAANPDESGIIQIPGSDGERYVIERLLGKGGFGTVYLAHDRILDQKVAVKVLRLSLTTRHEQKRFLFEARTSAKLRHPAIVNVFDIMQQEDKLQLIMEFYPGGSLSQCLKENGPIPAITALRYLRQICQGLAYAHKNGIVHRDLKPANIFLAENGEVKLGDFGIAAHTDTHENTVTGEVMGSPLYMSPEQTRDSKNIDGRADIYSLGLTLYHMVTGKPPRLVDLDEIDPILRAMIRQTTADNPDDRPQSCDDLIKLIDQAIGDLIMSGRGTEPGIAGAGAGQWVVGTGTGTMNLHGSATVPGTSLMWGSPTGSGPSTGQPPTGSTGATGIPSGYSQASTGTYGTGSTGGGTEATLTAQQQPQPGTNYPQLAQPPAASMMRFMIIGLVGVSMVIVAGFVAVIAIVMRQQRGVVPVAADGRQIVAAVPTVEPTVGGEIKPSPAAPAESPAAPASPAPTEMQAPAPTEAAPPPQTTPKPESAKPQEIEPVREGGVDQVPRRPSLDDALDQLGTGTGSRAQEAAVRAEKAFADYQKKPDDLISLRLAVENFGIAVKESPTNAGYAYKLGLVHEQAAQNMRELGMKEKAAEAARNAISAFQTAIDRDPLLKTKGIQDAKRRIEALKADTR